MYDEKQLFYVYYYNAPIKTSTQDHFSISIEKKIE